MKKVLIIFFIASVFLIILIFFYVLKFNDHKLHVVVCDVGQGDAIFVSTPSNSQILIDGGPDRSVLDCLASNMPFWDRTIDAVILTHPHADHLVGLIAVVDRYGVKSFYTEQVSEQGEAYKLLKLRLAVKNVSANYLTSGDIISEKNGAKVYTLWPRLNTLETADQNSSKLDLNGLSVVQILEYGDFSMLFTGDAGSNVLDQIIADVGDIDVLKVPHHGSKTGMSDIFISESQPEFGIISVGKDNYYGHPSNNSLDLLRKYQVKILRTDVDGQIEIVSDGVTWSVKTSQN